MNCTFQSPGQSWDEFFKVAKEYDVGLFVGAGMSLANGAPPWRSLAKQLGGWSDADMEKFSCLGISVESLFEIAKRKAGDGVWSARLRDAIYGRFYNAWNFDAVRLAKGSLKNFIKNPPVNHQEIRRKLKIENRNLTALIKLCSPRIGRINDRVGPILTTNVDCYLQLYDHIVNGEDGAFQIVQMATGETESGKLSVYHLHGYLSAFERDQKAIPFVFTESEYLERNDSAHSWANTTMHYAFREFNMMFLGFSMSDNLVRRALHRSCNERKAYLSESPDEKDWRRHYCVIEQSEEKVDLVRNESLANLGVWPLWVQNYDKDIGARLKELATYLK